MFGSRAKGSKGEREVAKICEQWWRKLEPGCRFVKTPLSGGWGGPALRGHFSAAGDLMCTAKQCPFAFEVKRREQWSLKNLFDGRPCPAWAWWCQAQQAALEMPGKTPMLWLRKNRMQDWFVLLPLDYVQAVPGLASPDVVWSSVMLKRARIDYGARVPALYLARKLLKHEPALFVVGEAA